MKHSNPRSRPDRAGTTTRMFPRERLYARLDAALAAPLTLVVADEGQGKSTLVHDYLALRERPHVRFTAGPEHADTGDFVRGLAAIFAEVRPGLTRSAAAAALRSGGSAVKVIARTWAREHLTDLDLLVVLDDLHHVTDPASIEFITALIEASAPRIRWILALRDAAGYPVPRWLAADLVALPIEADELRVQPDEIVAAFAAAGVALDPAGAAALCARTGGWPLGLAVALRSGRISEPLSQAAVYDGLVDAALLRCTSAQRDDLFATAVAGRFEPALLAALECDSAFVALLFETELVHMLDDVHVAYFEPYRVRLQARLAAFTRERQHVLLDRTASALECVGRWPEALALRVRAGDPQRVANALDRCGFTALDRGETTAVGRALAAVDDAVLALHPTALGLKAALASIEERYDVSEAWFSMAIRGAREGERRALVLRYGLDLVRRGRPDVIELLEAETERDETAADVDAEAALWALLGTAYVNERRRDPARAAAARALARLPGVRDAAVRARVLHQASYVALDAGAFDEAKALAERSLARAEEIFLYDIAARALSVLFNVAMLFDEDVVAARDVLLRLEQAGRKAGNDALKLYAIVNAYAIEVDAGDRAALGRMNRELAEMQVLLTPMVSEGLLPAQALRAAWDGRFEHAYEMLAPSAEKMFDDDRTAYRWAEVAIYAAAAGRFDAAHAALNAARTVIEDQADRQPLVIRANAYLALTEALLGDDAAAAATVAKARQEAAEMHVRIQSLVAMTSAFIDCRRPARDEAERFGRVVTLGERFEDLRRNDLGGVARFIGRLPLRAIAPLDRAVSE